MFYTEQDRTDAYERHKTISDNNPGRAIAHLENRPKSTGIDFIAECSAATPRNKSLILVARVSEINDSNHELRLCPECVSTAIAEREQQREKQRLAQEQEKERQDAIDAIHLALTNSGNQDLADLLNDLV